MWRLLRGRRFQDFKFRRQHPIGPYILDFYCPTRRLALELDGGQHFEAAKQEYDARRTDFLQQMRISVRRFPNDQMLLQTDAVLEEIARALGCL